MIGIIGNRNIGRSLIKGLIKKDSTIADKIYVSDNNKSFVENISEFEFNTTIDNSKVINMCNIIFICIKPDVYRIIANDIKENLTEDKVIVSLAPNHTLDELKKLFNHKNP